MVLDLLDLLRDPLDVGIDGLLLSVLDMFLDGRDTVVEALAHLLLRLGLIVSRFPVVHGAAVLLLAHLLACIAELVETPERRLHGLISLRLGLEAELEERLE